MERNKISLINIFHLFLVAFSFFIILYTVYRSEILHNGDRRSYYFFYYIFSFGNFLFWVTLFFFNDEYKKVSIITIVIVYFGFFLFEISLHNYNINSNKDIRIILKSKINNIKFDTRNRLEIYKDLKKENKDVTLTFAPWNLISNNGITVEGKELFPLAGVSKSETIYCNESGKYNNYKSDRYGFNNPDKIWDANNIEWGLIGDSFTHGACVDNKYNLAEKISFYSNKPSLNLGYSANGPLIEFATIIEYLMLKKPKKVLFFYNEGNDLNDLNNELSSPLLKKYLDKNFNQNLKNSTNQILINKGLRELINQKYNKKSKYTLKQKLKLMKIRLNYFDNKTNTTKIESKIPKYTIPDEFKKILIDSSNLINSYNGKFYFIYLPDYWSLKNDIKNKENYYNRNEVVNLVKSINIEVIDIYDLFRQQKDTLSLFPFKEYGHYNADGYDLIAKYIVNKISKLENNK
tara:strand:- start:215 stop:1600 length:1386 start_codon:yes stop_codon:yes gene_type:complete